MALPDLDRDSEGAVVLPFSLAIMTRASGAWHPDDGKAYVANRPRITEDRVPVLDWKPKVFYSFPNAEEEMKYAVPLIAEETFLERKTRFETEFPEFTKVALGTSFQGKPVDAYRLGPITRKHMVFINVVHGNEHDGLNGAFKAMEILATEAEFAPTRDEWTLFFVPCLNPDGYNNNLRNLVNVGPNGQTVNLNRNWNWFWDEYSETSLESKGATAESEVETLNLLNYWRTGNAGGPVTFGVLFDAHANQGEGVRYQSRDRIWRDIPYGPGESAPSIPDSYVAQYFDYYVWKTHAAIDTERYYEGEVPREMHVSYRRSRMMPHLHSYFSSQGIPCMIIEELKVSAAGGRETIKTACDFRMDYMIALAVVCTDDYWTWEDACLIEKGGTNILTNANWYQLQPNFERPSYYSISRATTDPRSSIYRYEDGGNATELTASLSAEMDTGEEYLCACADGSEGVVILEPSTGKIFRAGEAIYSASEVHTLARTDNVGAAIVYSGPRQVDILGGGTALATGAVTTATRLTNLDTTPVEAGAGGNITTARVNMGYCDNFITGITAMVDARGYLFGGFDGAGTRLTSLGTWNPNTAAFTASGDVLPTAAAGVCAVYYPGTDSVYLFGGDSAGGMLDTIVKWVIGTDTVTTLVAVLPTAKAYMAGLYDPLSGKIYILGGEDDAGDMSDEILEFDPSDGSITAVTYYANLTDSEEDAYDEDAVWSVLIGRNAAAHYENEDGTTDLWYPGGRLNDGAGALEDSIYLIDPPDTTVGVLGLSTYGYIRYSSVIDDERYATVVDDDFAAGILPANWTDPNGAWSDGGGFAKGVSATTGPLIDTPTVDQLMNSIQATVSMSGSGNFPDTGAVGRAAYTGATLDDGYRVRYTDNGTTKVWLLERINSTAVTVLDSKDVSGVALEQITAAGRVMLFEVEDSSPVWIQFTFNGNSIFDYDDFSADRITVIGQMALFGGST